MQSICTKHEESVHSCIERIINRFKEDMLQVLDEKQEPHITVTCAQVDSMLAYATSAGYHQLEHHVPEWQAVIYKHQPGIACAKCGIFFTSRILEEARRLGVL